MHINYDGLNLLTEKIDKTWGKTSNTLDEGQIGPQCEGEMVIAWLHCNYTLHIRLR